jgi:hypothetical protein
MRAVYAASELGALPAVVNTDTTLCVASDQG